LAVMRVNTLPIQAPIIDAHPTDLIWLDATVDRLNDRYGLAGRSFISASQMVPIPSTFIPHFMSFFATTWVICSCCVRPVAMRQTRVRNQLSTSLPVVMGSFGSRCSSVSGFRWVSHKSQRYQQRSHGMGHDCLKNRVGVP
jgi:hypothetical protein